MKVPINCMACFHEQGIPNFHFEMLEINNEWIFDYTCAKGHRQLFEFQNERYEILFDIGANALLDGYYRESISSFVASLERFYEFAIKQILFKKLKEVAIVDQEWKRIGNQSERQLGAFLMLWLMEFGVQAKILPEKQKMSNGMDYVQYRNAVIHKGYLPKYYEALEFGEQVLSIIRSNTSYLNGYLSDRIKINKSGMKLKIEPEQSQMVMITTIIGLGYDDDDHHKKSLKEGLDFIKKGREMVDELSNLKPEDILAAFASAGNPK